MSAPFTLVTDDASMAAAVLFARDVTTLPAFVTMVDTATGLNVVPTRSRAFAFWSRADGLMLQMWREQRGRFDVDGAGILDQIAEWRSAIWHHRPASPAVPAESPLPQKQTRQTRYYS